MQPELRFASKRVRFASKRDGWLMAIIWGAVLVSLVALLPLREEPPLQAGLVVLIVATIVGGDVVMLWISYGTGYTLDDERLRIRSGPFRWLVPLAEIHAIMPTRNPLSSPAMSLDRLRVEYGEGSAVMISPEDAASFLSAVVTRAPQLELAGDRATRRGGSA